ncbi:hypothetical protein Tco_0930755, partial [Tanacetum coccineum]
FAFSFPFAFAFALALALAVALTVALAMAMAMASASVSASTLFALHRNETSSNTESALWDALLCLVVKVIDGDGSGGELEM